MEIEAILVALDVGTSKVAVLVGEVTSEGALDIIGKGSVPSSGLRKGLVNNIEQTVDSIQQAIEQAERLSGLRLEAAFVAVGGDHVQSLNSRGTVAVSGAHREVTHEDIERATEVALALGWQIVATAPAEGRLEATDRTRWFGFRDDVVVRVRPDGAGSRVDVRSVSRVGRSDLGTNARRIQAFLAALRTALAAPR